MYAMELRKRQPLKWLTVTGMLMSMNIVMSSFSLPVPGGHLYLNDVVICSAALLLDPLGAFLVGGVGAFLGDFFFYPAPMFVSLATHGLQAVLLSLIFHRGAETRPDGREPIPAAVLGLLTAMFVNVLGYSLGRAFVYGTPAGALLKLPFQIFQAGFGSLAAGLLYFRSGLRDLWEKFVRADARTPGFPAR